MLTVDFYQENKSATVRSNMQVTNENFKWAMEIPISV